ncbi:MAG: hypothetical protein DRO39_03375 [Thermoprotei archaeon]|nr:MAG: hypothetical protein DRO39_03375 [Thermoprotei archaeon]
MVHIRIEAEIRPTESEKRVVQAIKRVFFVDEVRIVELGNGTKLAVAEADEVTPLLKIYELLRRQRILDTARSVFLRNSSGSVLSVKLNKQVAYQGIVSFVDSDDESPLGAINLVVVSDKLREIIDWLAPRTAHGRPLWEKDVPRNV